MAKSDKSGDPKNLAKLKADLAAGTPENGYVFYGEERYLLEYYLGQLQKLIVSEGFEEFNYHRFEAKSMDMSDLIEAVDALPVFAERTMIEVWDFDFPKSTEEARRQLAAIVSDLPDYTTLVFVYDTIPYAAEGKSKEMTAFRTAMTAVEFPKQAQSDLNNWIGRRFKACGKQIDRADAEYFSFVTGGLMTTMIAEVEKVAAYAAGTKITRADIDAVVIPVVDAAVYNLTDALLKQDYNEAAARLEDLYAMQLVPQQILSGLGSKFRQLLAAKVLREAGQTTSDLMKLCGIRHDFQARTLMNVASRTDMSKCRRAVDLCSDAAFKMNMASTKEGEEILNTLFIELAVR